MTTAAVLKSRNRSQIGTLWRAETPVSEIALKLDMDEEEVEELAQEMGLAPRPTTNVPASSPTIPRSVASTETARPKRRKPEWRIDNEAFKRDWRDGVTIREMGEVHKMAPGSVSKHAKVLGLEPRRRGRQPAQSQQTTPKQPPSANDGQRRFKGTKPREDGKGKVQLHPWHPAVREGATIYGKSVTPASHMERLLKSGEHNRKIGKLCTKGRWKGMPIYTLTLEERATCPRTCEAWSICYGNRMGQTKRIIDDGWLTTKLYLEMVLLAIEHPQGFIVRLHVLGDFYSEKYVKFWDDALYLIPQLHIFGFTARLPDTPIGQALVHLMNDHLDQVAMRWSGLKMELHGSEVIQREEDAIGIVCPAQEDEDRSCATCSLCWNSERTISFLEH